MWDVDDGTHIRLLQFGEIVEARDISSFINIFCHDGCVMIQPLRP